MIQEVAIGELAIPFIRSCLWPQRALPARLLNLPFEKGRVVAYAPEGVGQDRLTEFEAGLGVPGATEKLANFVLAYLQSPGAPYAVFQDYFSRPGDPALTWDQFFLFDSEVYLYLGRRDASVDRIHDAISEASEYPFLAILTSVPPGEPPKQGVASEACLEALADRTQHLIVGAYDEESYVVWSR